MDLKGMQIILASHMLNFVIRADKPSYQLDRW